ncbi:hypothetical protein LCGC14_0684570 [marine sediment metagenome]|uniref:Large polyvalent protein associated domain-containing protein n=1 Tax=marine sediment metagenome TaxID=412755 RepID=A0A0F9QSB4_9ZZZZ
MAYEDWQKENQQAGGFDKWYAGHASRLRLDPNPDDPQHFYDYRAAYAAGAEPDYKTKHWPSEFKTEGHPRMVVGGVNTKTGKPDGFKTWKAESVPEAGGKFRGAGATGTWEEPTLLGGTLKEFGKGLISSELGVAKATVGTAKAATELMRKIPAIDIAYRGVEKITGKTFKEEQAKMKANIASVQERFAMTHDGTGAWAGRVIGEAIPYMANAMAGGYAVGPVGAAAVGFTIEGDNAYDAAITTGAPEGQAQRERVIVGSINAAIEALQIGRLMKFHQAGKHSIKGFIQLVKDKAYKQMFTTGKQFGADILKLSIENAIEGFSQEGVSIGVPALFRGEYPKKEDGTIDYWALGERLGEAALAEGVAGGVLGTGGRVQMSTKAVSESIPEAVDELELNMFGHAIPEVLGMQTEERRAYMEALTGKRSMSDMNLQEKEDFMWQLRKDADEAGIDLNILAQGFQPAKELNKQLRSLKRYKEPLSRGAVRRRSSVLKIVDKIGELGQSYLLNQDRMKNLTRMLDGYKDDGPLSRLIQEPMKTATVKAKDASNQLMFNLRESATERGIDISKMTKRKAKPEIIKDFPLSDGEAIGIYWLAQNPKARADIEAMFKEDNIDPDTAIKSVQEYVEKDDDLMYVYRDHRAYFDTMGPRFFDTVDQLDLKGVVREENYLTMLLNKGNEEGTADILQEFTSQFGLVLPGKKHVKERTGAIRDINLDIFSITSQASRSLERFINVAPVAKRVNDLIENPKFKRNLNATTKDQGVKIFKRWLVDSARGTSDYNTTGVERTIKLLRRNAVIYTLGAKVITVMPKQAISLSNAVAKRPAMLPAVLKTVNVMADPRVAKQLEERARTKSSLVRNRSWERDLRAIYNDKNIRKFFEGKSLSPISMRPISWMDRKTVTVVWNSAYDLATADGLEEKQAIKYADDFIETTQPMADATDLPGYFRGGIAEKTFTTFMNQRNQNWQALRHDILGEYRAGEISKSMVMYRFLFSQVLPSVMLGMITRGRLPEDAKEMGLDLASYMITPLIFGGRFIYNLATGEWDPITSEVSTIPARGPEEIVRGVSAAKRGDVRGAVEHGIGAVGAFTGKIPQQALTTTGGMIDLMMGETDDYKRLIYSKYMIEKYGKEEPTTGRATRRAPIRKRSPR